MTNRAAVAVLTAVVLSVSSTSCATFAPGVTPRLVAGSDSLTQAYETGRRDAERELRDNWGGFARRLAFPLSLLLINQATSVRAILLIPTAISSAFAVYSGTRLTRPLPEPSAAVRDRYQLSPRMWAEYRAGYQEVHYEYRRQEFVRDTQSAVVSLVTYLIFTNSFRY